MTTTSTPTEPSRRVDGLSGALDAWRSRLGDEFVIVTPDALELASTATYSTEPRVLALLRPASREEVQDCVRIANRFRVPLYPVSAGKNWGLGSRVPVLADAVVVSLDRMDRIVDYSEELSYITVEPGVTFEAAYRFLRARNSSLMFSVTGSTAEGSLVGNALERGHGYGPFADRFAETQAAEVVLPNGQCIHGGFDKFAGAAAAQAHRWGVGPHLDGMFTQSNLGIVTRMTFNLHPLPVDLRVVRAHVKSTAKLDGFIAGLRAARLDGACDMRIWNSDRAVGPERTGEENLGERMVGVLTRRFATPESWFTFLGVYSPSRAIGDARMAHLRATLAPKCDGFWVHNADKVHSIGSKLRLWRDIRKSPLVGVPMKDLARMAYHGKPGGAPANGDYDADRDRCGLLWCCPSVPFTAAHILRLAQLNAEVAARHGHRNDISLRPPNARTVDCVVGAFFDRDEPGADERALAWHDDCFRTMSDAGYPPYRVSTRGMSMLPPVRDDSATFLGALKKHLDPNDILAPGRYDFRNQW